MQGAAERAGKTRGVALVSRLGIKVSFDQQVDHLLVLLLICTAARIYLVSDGKTKWEEEEPAARPLL